jgi:56kDa selenium binding protein (SBP56)
VDAQFCPEGINGWMAKIDFNPASGTSVDPNFFVPFKANGRIRPVCLPKTLSSMTVGSSCDNEAVDGRVSDSPVICYRVVVHAASAA